MAKTKISEFSATPANNTDIDSINIAEGCAPSGINDAIRELMAQLKDFQTGAVGDSFNGPVGTSTAAAGAFTTLSANSTVTFTGLSASQAVFTDASDNLVSNAITGTGNVVMSASPTLTGTLTASAITASSTITGNGNWVLGNADTDTITQSASYVTGTVLRSAKSATNTLNLAAYDVDGAAYTNLITLTAANAPTLALTSTGVGTINNMSIGATTASTGAFTTLSASGAVTLSGGTANGVAYLNGSKVVTSGSALTFDGTTLNNSGAFGTSTAALTLKNSSAANSSNIVEQQFFASNSFSGLDTIAKFGALNPSAGGNNYGTFYWSLANAGSPSEQMRLTSTGLGIGTTSIGEKLVVSGSASVDVYKLRSNISAPASTDAFIYRPADNTIGFGTGSAEKMRLDSSGNLGLGVTPSAWGGGSGNRAIEVGFAGSGLWSNSANNTVVTSNAYFNGSGWRYGATGTATISQQDAGAHKWYNAPSGTAGNAITFTQAATLTADGDFLVGTTSSAGRLTVQGSDSTASNWSAWIRNSASTDLFRVRNDGYFLTGSATNSPYNFTTGSAANVFIDSNGGLLRSTSSLKYKTDVQDAVHGLPEVMQLRPVTYKGKNDGDTVFGGLIAEEVHDVGLTEFVQYAQDGSPDALAYGNMVSLCIKAIQELKAEFDAYKATHP